MKAEIHPNYQATIFNCACGNRLETSSYLGGEVSVEICSSCHPFFKGDGKDRVMDSAGRIEKFKKRYQGLELSNLQKKKKA